MPGLRLGLGDTNLNVRAATRASQERVSRNHLGGVGNRQQRGNRQVVNGRRSFSFSHICSRSRTQNLTSPMMSIDSRARRNPARLDPCSLPGCRVGIQRVGVAAEALVHGVFEKAMNENDIATSRRQRLECDLLGCQLRFSPSRQAMASSSTRTASSTGITGRASISKAGKVEQNL
jgi:hypothetical protein